MNSINAYRILSEHSNINIDDLKKMINITNLEPVIITDSKNNLLSKQMIEHFRTYASRILQEKSYPVSKLNQV